MNRFRKLLIGSGAAVLLSGGIVAAAGSDPAFAGVATCSSSTATWAALYPTAHDWVNGQGATICIGDKGTFSVPMNNIQVFCAGNNNGTVWYDDLTTSTSASHTFYHDTSYYVSEGTYKTANSEGTFTTTDQIEVTKVQITGWTGSAGC